MFKLKRAYRRLRELFYVVLDARRLSSCKTLLFVDAGANVGQGYRWFSRHYGHRNVNYHLFEPNPNCHALLESLIKDQPNAKLFKVGIGARNERVRFYGLGNSEGGPLSVGGSIVKKHNFKKYTPNEENAVEVSLVNFGDYLAEQAARFDRIVVKMDVEGAEYAIMDSLFETGRHKLFDTIYIEFHSRVLPEPERSETRKKEMLILAKLREDGVHQRLWR